MSILKKLTPINFLEEKEKFFSDHLYNPQFIYEDEIPDKDLYFHGSPDTETLELANKIVRTYQDDLTEKEKNENDGPLISQQKVTDMVTTFLKMHDLEDRIDIIWSSSYISRATMTATTLKLKSTSEFHHINTLSMIYHELGTHAIRRINYENQPWFKRKKKYGFHEYLPTEEGLASIHSLLPKKQKVAYATALRYLASNWAQEYSFRGLWNHLEPYIENEEKRWTATFRQKRGLMDTSMAGGSTKDSVYFIGIIQVAKWLKENSYDPTPLYFGKLSWEDVEKAKELNPHFRPLLPIFIRSDFGKYADVIKEITSVNFLP